MGCFTNEDVDDTVEPDPPDKTSELKAWYMFDWSNSVYSQVVIGAYLPLLLQSMALANAGFPLECRNYYDMSNGMPNVTIPGTYFDSYSEGSGEAEAERSRREEGTIVQTDIPDITLTSMDIFNQNIDFFQDDALTGKSKAHIVGQMVNHTANTDVQTCTKFPDALCENKPGYDYNDDEWCSQYIFGADTSCTISVEGVGKVTRSPCWTLFCTGPPTSTFECLEADAKTEQSWKGTVSFGAIKLDPTAYATLFISFSVIFQCFTFISVAAVGDHGGNRKFLFVIFSTLGAITTICCIIVTPETYWLGGIFMVVSNVFFGTCFVLYNAWLPLLAADHSKVKAIAEGPERTAMYIKIIDEISTKGYATGYFGSLILLVMTVPIAFALESKMTYKVAIAMSGVWWLIFQMYTFKHLRTRPGPPLPAEYEGGCCSCWDYFAFSWKQCGKTLKDMQKVPQTFKFILFWFVFSDGAFLVGSVGVLMADTIIHWGTMSRSIGIAILLLEVPIFGGLGNVACVYLVDRYNIKTKKVIIFCLLWIGLIIPIWGMIGWATKSGSLPQNLEYCNAKGDDGCSSHMVDGGNGFCFFGFGPDATLPPNCDTVVDEGKPGFGIRRGWEILALGPIYGLPLGALQSYSRSLFGQLCPVGYESQFFAFYEITDKGSSWMGPIVVTALITAADKTDDGLRRSLIYILCMTCIPAVALFWFDEEKGIKDAEEFGRARKESLVAQSGNKTSKVKTSGIDVHPV